MSRLMTQDLEGNLVTGLLGGSFNPAHRGHLEVTDAARHLLGLQRCWWLVSPQNPLKSTRETAPLDERLARAEKQAAGRPWLSVTGIERQLGTQYTADTLTALTARFPRNRFVWIMGADNLAGFHRWSRWRQIAETMPIAVVSRPGAQMAALTSPAARVYAERRLRPEEARALPFVEPPAWVYLPVVHNPLSSTALRAG